MKVKHKLTHSKTLALHLMLIPGVIAALVFSYAPLFGSVMAFQDFNPARGLYDSDWIGVQNFRFLFALPGFIQAIRNTVFIALAKMALGLIVPITFALLLNEVRSRTYKKTVQTLIYLPYFLSWIILSGIFTAMLSPSEGIINHMLGIIGIDPIFFLGDTFWFPITMVVTDIWKNFGFGTIIYLAALTGINPELYEAAAIDGASRFKQTLHITLPGLRPIIILMTVLSLGNILNAGFDQIFNMYNISVYATGDIIDTFIYRLGMLQFQYGPAAAAGLFRSFVSFFFVSVSYYFAYKFADYKIF